MWRDMPKTFCWGNVQQENHLEDTGVDCRIILKWRWNDLGCINLL